MDIIHWIEAKGDINEISKENAEQTDSKTIEIDF